MASIEIVLHKVLKEELKNRKWSIQHLSERSEVPASTLDKWVRGDAKSPNVILLKKVAKTLGLGIEELLFGVHRTPQESNHIVRSSEIPAKIGLRITLEVFDEIKDWETK